MSFVRGHRFELDLGDDIDGKANPSTPSPASFIKDVRERPFSADAPLPPKPKLDPSGSHIHFPRHKRRSSRPVDAAAQSPQIRVTPSTESDPKLDPGHMPKETQRQGLTQHANGFETSEKRQIDAENKRRIASMSPAEIEKERNELMNVLSPGLIERLLKRASIDDERQRGYDDFHAVKAKPREESMEDLEQRRSQHQQHRKGPFAHNTSDDSKEMSPKTAAVKSSLSQNADSHLAPDSSDSSKTVSLPKPPSLDPSSSTFIADLHSTYFPTYDPQPTSLSWMSPIPETDPLTAYLTPALADQSTSSPTPPTTTESRSIPASALRFSLSGDFLPPNLASRIPSTKGLHHHAAAPAAAGYTIAELARLARSVVPAQRCVAYKALGGILRALGRGDFAMAEEGRQLGHDVYQTDQEVHGMSDFEAALWAVMKQERVREILSWESDELEANTTSADAALARPSGDSTDLEGKSDLHSSEDQKEIQVPKGNHASSRAYATDAFMAYRDADTARKLRRRPRRAV